ncbi:hypothetical protein FGO68_gene16163 [Halteria grandinella]|uniref:Transmembrane protein n=1 Tax=Halteria grandinella TaxID=5974 RepID=A0A8J8T0D5_HALGN|nr:hypothetical protein FGO68_gene16163 [Halteria grandinella]
MEAEPRTPSFSDVTQYTDMIIFPIVLASQLFVFIRRKFKLDVAAIITLLLYLFVMFIRFIRCFTKSGDNRFSPIQVGINIVCHTLISMTMYFFVFEMSSVKIQIEGGPMAIPRAETNRKVKYSVLAGIITYLVVYLTVRLISELGNQQLTHVELGLLYFSIALKLVLDILVMVIFMQVFIYFAKRKQTTLKREALTFSPFNKFILISVSILYASRIIGALFTFSNSLISISELYNTYGYSVYRLLMADVIFPIRDMFEALFFAYLFYFQSKKRVNMSILNEEYQKRISQLEEVKPLNTQNSGTVVSHEVKQSQISGAVVDEETTQFRQFLRGQVVNNAKEGEDKSFL